MRDMRTVDFARPIVRILCSPPLRRHPRDISWSRTTCVLRTALPCTSHTVPPAVAADIFWRPDLLAFTGTRMLTTRAFHVLRRARTLATFYLAENTSRRPRHLGPSGGSLQPSSAPSTLTCPARRSPFCIPSPSQMPPRARAPRYWLRHSVIDLEAKRASGEGRFGAK